MSADMPQFRPAVPGDEEKILAFIRALAEYEGMAQQVVATPALLRRFLFQDGRAEVLFVLAGEEEAGFALFFHNFSTFLGRPGIYLEDLFILPRFRGYGYGKALLQELARLAAERECGRLEWACLDWNESALGFYRALGAQPQEEWTTHRLTGQALRRAAEGPVPLGDKNG